MIENRSIIKTRYSHVSSESRLSSSIQEEFEVREHAPTVYEPRTNEQLEEIYLQRSTSEHEFKAAKKNTMFSDFIEANLKTLLHDRKHSASDKDFIMASRDASCVSKSQNESTDSD